MFATHIISQKGVRSSELICPRGCSGNSSSSNTTHDGSVMCSSCGLVLKADEFESEFLCGGLDKTRADTKPWMLSCQSKGNGSKSYYYSNNKNSLKGNNILKENKNSDFSEDNLVKIEENNRYFDGIKVQNDYGSSSNSRRSLNGNNSDIIRANIKEEWWENGKTTSGSWETRQREIGRQVGEICAKSQLNNAEREEISDLAESMLRVLDTKSKKCRSLRSLVAACFYECSKRARRPVAINELCQDFQVKQRKLLKYSKKLQKYHHSQNLSHCQRVNNEWEQLTGSMFEKLPSFISLSSHSMLTNTQSQEDKHSEFDIFSFKDPVDLIEESIKHKTVDSGIDIKHNLFGGKQLLSCFQQVGLKQQKQQQCGIATTYVPEISTNILNNKNNNKNKLLFRQQLKDIGAQNTAVILKNIQKQLKQLYDCEYLSVMRMGKHPVNFICTLLYALLKSHNIEFLNNQFCNNLGVKYSTLLREKKQLHQLLIDSLCFSNVQLPQQIIQELERIRVNSKSNQKKQQQQQTNKNNKNNNQLNSAEFVKEINLINKIEETETQTNDSSYIVNANHSNHCYNDARLSGGFLEYALRHVLMIDSATPFLDITSRECSNKKEEDNGIINPEEEDNFQLSYETSSIASSSLGENTTSNSNNNSNNHALSTSVTASPSLVDSPSLFKQSSQS